MYAHSSMNVKEVEDIIERCPDKSYALVSVYIDQNTCYCCLLLSSEYKLCAIHNSNSILF